MKIADLSCPNCDSQLVVDQHRRMATCQFCGSTFPIDDEAQHIKFDDLTQAGYDFEKGRQIAQSEIEPQGSKTKVVIIAVVVVLLIVAAFFVFGNKQPSNPGNTNEPVAVSNLSSNSDLNKFIENYNAISKSPITSAEKGSSTAQCFVESHGYDIGLSAEDGKMSVSINQTNANSNAGVAGMRDVFHDVSKTLDPTLKDDEIYDLFDSSVSDPPSVRRNHKLGDVTINYFPDEKRGLDTIRGHLVLETNLPLSK